MTRLAQEVLRPNSSLGGDKYLPRCLESRSGGREADGDAPSGVRLAATNTARITKAEARPYPALEGPREGATAAVREGLSRHCER